MSLRKRNNCLTLGSDVGTNSMTPFGASPISQPNRLRSGMFRPRPTVSPRDSTARSRSRFHGRIYRNIEELRDAVREFVERYNAEWLVEKNG